MFQRVLHLVREEEHPDGQAEVPARRNSSS
jgi:hypothetical protein